MTTDGLRQVTTLTISNEWPKEQFTSLSLAQERVLFHLPPSIPPFSRTSALNKDDTIGKQECRGSKKNNKKTLGVDGGSKQITFDPMLVNGYLTGSRLWGVYGLWLSGPVCTKVMCLWKGPWIDSFFSLCVVWLRAPGHSYHWAVTVRRRVTLWKYTLGSVGVSFCFLLAGHCSCSSQENNEGAAPGLAAAESNSKWLPMQN